mmetsp:Transcript_21805/g.64290  ORF Transcript_21805/g.64290 Transcript_21805/m.64290 type:complete len:237 (-) Transcript_21805:1300-2010(-)
MRRVRASGEADPLPGAREARGSVGHVHVRTFRNVPSGTHGVDPHRSRSVVGRFLREDIGQIRERRRMRGVQAGRGLHTRLHDERDHSRRRTGRPPRYQRSSPRQHAARGYLFRRTPRPGRRAQPRSAHRPRRRRQQVQPLLQDYGRAAGRSLRRGEASAPRHLGGFGQRRIRERTRVREGPPHRQIVRRIDVVPLRRSGFGRLRRTGRESIQGHPLPSQDEGRGERMREGMRRGCR